MGFKINVENQGSTSTIKVWQKINNNEDTKVLDKIIETGDSVSVNAFETEEYGNDGGDFAWEHVGSSKIDNEFVAADGTLIVDD